MLGRAQLNACEDTGFPGGHHRALTLTARRVNLNVAETMIHSLLVGSENYYAYTDRHGRSYPGVGGHCTAP